MLGLGLPRPAESTEMSTLSGTRCGIIVVVCFAAFVADKQGDTQKIKIRHPHLPASGPVRIFALEEGFTDSVSTVALPPVDREKQQWIRDPVASHDDGETNSISFLGRNWPKGPIFKKLSTKESTDGLFPGYGYRKVSSTPFVPLQSANEPIYVSNAENANTKGSELWGSGFSSLFDTGGWQAFFSHSGEWTLNPRIFNEGYGAPERFIQKRKPAAVHVEHVSKKEGVSYINQIWKPVTSMQQIIPNEMLPSRWSASPTTCILCVLFLAYVYLLFRLMTICARLQRTKRHLLPSFHCSPSHSTECPPQRRGLPSGALLIMSRSSYRGSNSVERATRNSLLPSKSFNIRGRSDLGGKEDGMRRNSFSTLSIPYSLGRPSGTGPSRRQFYPAVGYLRTPDMFTLPLGQSSLHDCITERSCSLGISKQLEGSVVQQPTERGQTEQEKSRWQHEQLEEYQLDEKGQKKVEHGGGYDDDIDRIGGGTTAEARGSFPPQEQRAYMLLCYPGLWKDAAYDPYLLECSMRCVSLSPEVKLSPCGRPQNHKALEYLSCEPQQSVIQDEAALRLAATHIRQRSFGWWEAYLAMCCGCACCLLILSVYSDSVRFSSVYTSTTPIQSSLPPHAGKKPYSQLCPRAETASLSSLFQAEDSNSFSSATGTVVALFQWTASLCLLRACLVDYTQITTRRLRARARTKADAATAALSLLYLFFLFCLVPSLFSVPASVPLKHSFPLTYDRAAPRQEWYNRQANQQLADVILPMKDKFGVTEAREDAETLQEADGQKDVVSDAVAQRKNVARHNGTIIASYRRPLSFSQVGEQGILAARQFPAAGLSKSKDNTSRDDVQKLTKTFSTKKPENAQQLFDKHEGFMRTRVEAHQQRRELSGIRGEEVESPLLEKQYSKEYGNKQQRFEGLGENATDATIMTTGGVLLLLLCHALPRLWAFYTVLKLVRENGVFIVWRNSSTQPSFTSLVSWVNVKIPRLSLRNKQRMGHFSL